MSSKRRVTRKRKVVTLISLLTTLILTGFISCQNLKEEREPSFDEQHTFWIKNVQQVAEGQLMSYKFPIPEVRQRYTHLVQKVIQRYDKFTLERLHGHLLSGDGKRVAATCTTRQDGREGVVVISIPALMKRFDPMQRVGNPGWREAFERSVIITIMHEFEHLAHDRLTEDHFKEHKNLVKAETGAWHRTCKFTIQPLFEKYGFGLDWYSNQFYELWCQNGKSDGDQFQSAISKIYTKSFIDKAISNE
jgi:hypothetical protein